MTRRSSSRLRASVVLPLALVTTAGVVGQGVLPAAAVTVGSSTVATAAVPELAVPLLLARAGTGASWAHPGAAALDHDVTVTVSADKAHSGGGTYLYVVGRQVTSSSTYRLVVRYEAGGAVTARLTRFQSGVDTVLQSVTVPGLDGNRPTKVRLVVSGQGTTSLKAKVWQAPSSEPAAWSLTAADSTPALQAPGRVAALGHLSGSATNGPLTLALGLADTSAVPVISSTDPTGGVSRASAFRFDLSAPRSDVSFRCGLDSGPLVACSTPVSYTGVPDGTHTVVVAAVDAAGVVTGTASRSWANDSTAPDTALTSTSALGGTTATFGFSANESSTFSCRLDAAAWTPCSSPVSFADLQPGTHAFAVRATDRAGNVDASPAERTWTVVAPPLPPSTPTTAKPGPTNTGVPAGTVLTPHYGNLTITTPGARLDGIDLHGFLDIKAPDVVVTRSLIRGGPTTVNKSLIHSTGARVIISDTTLLPSHPSVDVDGLKGHGFTASRLDVSGTVDTALIYGNDTTIRNSWLHDNRHYLVDPSQGGTPSHDDSVQVQGGSRIRITNNTMSGAWNAAVQVTQDYAVTSDLQVTGNWLGGGGCTVNIAQKARGPIAGLVVSDNLFSRDSRLDCAIISPSTTVLTAVNDLWVDTLTPVRIRFN